LWGLKNKNHFSRSKNKFNSFVDLPTITLHTFEFDTENKFFIILSETHDDDDDDDPFINAMLRRKISSSLLRQSRDTENAIRITLTL
jgi:hypothetical protein